jgi:hypothetical protein
VIVVKRYIYLALASVVTLIILLFGTNPRNISSAALITPFILIFLTLFFVSSYFLRLRGLTRRADWAIAVFITVPPTLLLVLQSIGQLTLRDVATIVALFAIAYFYATRIDSPAK